jgi:flagellar basal-body rod protein FlgG
MSGAMFTAVTGATGQQVKIDVIANNLANLSTVGFKRMTAQFEDLLYETVRSPGGEGDAPSGLQFGRGTRVASTAQIHTSGSLRQTEQALDLAIEGQGFLQVRQLNGDVAYTRDGSLSLDVNGNLVNSAGLLLDPPITIPPDALTITITQDGRIEVTQPGSATPTEVGQIELARFSNPAGLRAIGHNLLAETTSSGTPQTGTPGEDAFGTIAQGSLEESNVNIAEELVNMILAQRAFEANTRVISTTDEMLRSVTQR